MKNRCIRWAQLGALALGTVHCAGSADLGAPGETAEPRQTEESVRNGMPILFTQNEAVVAITNGTLGFGSGTLLAPDWVLTAGHMVDAPRTKTSNISVRWGNSTDSTAQVRSAAAIYMHPKHTPGQSSQEAFASDVDVALIHLSSSFSGALTRNVSNDSTSSMLSTMVFCMGYGPTVEGTQTGQGTLNGAWLEVINFSKNWVRVVQNNGLLFGSQMVVGGDSGGPCLSELGEIDGVISTGDPMPAAVGTFAPAAVFKSWVSEIMGRCGGKTPGSSSFCDSVCGCTQGNGDCDNNSDCSAGNVCDNNVGAAFGMTPDTEVCVPASCAEKAIGSSSYCSSSCPCGYGGSDCDSDSQCLDGFTCVKDVGAGFKQSADTDVCLPTACKSRKPGSSSYCSKSCPCGHGGGDCDSVSQCMPGLVCADDMGLAFDMSESTSVCMPKACADVDIYSSKFCSSDCPCGVGGGDCDDDGDCLPGLVCGNNNGDEFGQSASTDICVRP